MTFAIIATGGKQYPVTAGQVLKIEKIQGDKQVVFDKVLLVDDGTTTEVGTPYLSGKKITAERLADGRAKKITVVKFKSKSNYRVKKGHRQPFTTVKILTGF